MLKNNKFQRTATYIQNRSEGSKFKDCNTLQNSKDLISVKPTIPYETIHLTIDLLDWRFLSLDKM